jgi:hypothetical protein
MSELVAIRDIAYFMRNVRTRMPFKYGIATLTSVPILHVVMAIESRDGKVFKGVSADILPPKWFDKDPSKDYEENVEDLVFSAREAGRAYLESSRKPRTIFEIWKEGYRKTLDSGDARGLNHLTSGHGSSLMERALIDGLGKMLSMSYHEMLAQNVIAMDPGELHPELRGQSPSDFVVNRPLDSVFIRHTVGLADPITTSEISDGDRLEDGLPHSLEEYLTTHELKYLKIKVSGQLEQDLSRLCSIADLLSRTTHEYRVTLDGNEQYGDLGSFLELLDSMRQKESLQRLYDNILFIEQPLDRSVALNPELADGIRAVSKQKPMLVDESDGDIGVFKEAIQLGYRGVSSKNCKGLIKAIANMGLAQYHGERYFLSGEDLMNLPVVPVHQDLTHLATLGIDHVERNGHHYVRGLDHLSDSELEHCRQDHSRLYRETGSSLVLDIQHGKIDISSLQRPGLGVGDCVDVAHMTPLDEWRFDSLA